MKERRDTWAREAAAEREVNVPPQKIESCTLELFEGGAWEMKIPP